MPLMLWWMCITRFLQRYNVSDITQTILKIKGFELFEILFYLIGIELLVNNNITIEIIFYKKFTMIALLIGLDIF